MQPKWIEIRNEALEGPVEVMIYGRIGSIEFDGDTTTVAAKQFAESLKAIPRERQIVCRINSVGGSVWEGLAIYNILRDRRATVTCRVDGVAASIASVIACAGNKTIMPSGALMMVHPPTMICIGDAKAMRESADILDTNARAIANVYASKTGKSQKEMLDMMSVETWMTGAEAKEKGLCDELIAEDATNAIRSLDLSGFSNVPECARKSIDSNAPTIPDQVSNMPENSEEAEALPKVEPRALDVLALLQTAQQIPDPVDRSRFTTSIFAQYRKQIVERFCALEFLP